MVVRRETRDRSYSRGNIRIARYTESRDNVLGEHEHDCGEMKDNVGDCGEGSRGERFKI